MTNLLPLSEKKKIQTLYHYRLTAVSLVVTLVLCIIGLLFILPSFFLAMVKENDANERLTIAREATAANSSDEIGSLVQETVRMVTILSEEASDVPPVSQLFPAISDRRAFGVTLSGFFYTHDTTGKKVVVRGHAPDRDSLIAFVDALSEVSFFKKVDLPVSFLVNNRDIEFSLTITLSEVTVTSQ